MGKPQPDDEAARDGSKGGTRVGGVRGGGVDARTVLYVRGKKRVGERRREGFRWGWESKKVSTIQLKKRAGEQ